MKKESDSIDMMAELFIDKQQEGITEWLVPPLTKEECLKKAREAINQDEMIEALGQLILSFRSENISRNGFYTGLLANKLADILNSFVSVPSFKNEVADFLLREGSYCEKARDYESGVVFYRACVALMSEDPFNRYFSLNNLGFCLNVVRKFDEAEKVLRKAIDFSPEKYNAWKNIGVSLEWQGQYEEAAECYLKAYNVSKGEPRSHLHLKRLLDRHPTLKKLPCFN